ncbi:hypothetical protein Sp245p_30680 (plasmid) [Azospirillum baldaniorum]|uniref:Uncharacterized protein n=1 Tax=Azospirillum baldaniorum TaxID=1064539 RepID=A0A9P1JXC1_9PROT|nr:hypothetical protein Sp245p_30680 [Azospirillum baldaniorum]CCD01491.1 protein of unknown function [Azospirillum baldaniorum]
MQGCDRSTFYSVPIPAPMTPLLAGRVRLCEDGSGVACLCDPIPQPGRGKPSANFFCFATERTDPNGTSQGTARSDQWKGHKDTTVRFRMVIIETSPDDTEFKRKHFK